MSVDRSLSLKKDPIHAQSIKPALLPAFSRISFRTYLLSFEFVPRIVLSVEVIAANKQDSLSSGWACSLGGEKVN